MSQETDSNDRADINRRRFVQTASAVGIAGIAGCASDSNDSGDDGNSSSGNGDTTTTTTGTTTAEDNTGGTPVDDTFDLGVHWIRPKNIQWNPYNQRNYGGTLYSDWLARFSLATGDFMPVLAADWTLNSSDQTFRLELASDHTWWHSDNQVTAGDAITKFQMDKHMQIPYWEYLSGVEATGEKTVKINLSNNLNSAVIKHEILPIRINTPKEKFKEYLTRFEEASSDDERNSIRKELLNWAPKTPWGNAPYQVERTTGRKVECTVHEGHPVADELNWSQWGMWYTESNQQRWSMVKGDQIDCVGVFAPADVIKGFPNHWEEVQVQRFSGMGLVFQHDHEIWGQRPARQAIAYVINRTNVAKNSGAHVKSPVAVPTGIVYNQKEWIDPSQYLAYEQDTERATELLRDVGLEKSDGSWQYDGSPVTITLKAPAGYSDWISGMQTVAAQLREFGFTIDFSPEENTTFWGSSWPNGEYDMTAGYWGGWGPYPHASFQAAFVSTDAKESYHYPESVTIPMPVGAFDSEGSMKEISPADKVNSLAVSQDETATKLIRELAWAYNLTLPRLPIQRRAGQAFFDTKDWNVPLEDKKATEVVHPYSWTPRTGKLKAKTK